MFDSKREVRGGEGGEERRGAGRGRRKRGRVWVSGSSSACFEKKAR